MESKGFKMTRSKTEYMECVFSGRRTDPEEVIRVGDQAISTSDALKYLGSIIQSDGEVDKDVTHRIKIGWQKWRSATGVLCDKRIPLRLKNKFYHKAIRPAMLYGGKCWPIKKAQVKQLLVAEMRMLRWICGHTLLDKIKSDVIRSRTPTRNALSPVP